MISQWEDEWISPSVPSVAQVMIAQWEDISPSVPSVAQVMIARWKNECISLSVLPVVLVQFPAVAEYFKRFFPGWSDTLGEEMGTAKSSQAPSLESRWAPPSRHKPPPLRGDGHRRVVTSPLPWGEMGPAMSSQAPSLEGRWAPPSRRKPPWEERIFPWLIRHTCRGDGHCQVVTRPLPWGEMGTAKSSQAPSLERRWALPSRHNPPPLRGDGHRQVVTSPLPWGEMGTAKS